MLTRLAVFAVLIFAHPVLADGFDYAVTGNGCVPDNISIENGLYESRGHGVGFKPGKIGTIRMTCPITMPRRQDGCFGCAVGDSIYNWSSMTLYYKDTDGAQSGSYLNMKLRYASFGSPDVGLDWVNATPAFAATTATNAKISFKDVNPTLYDFWWIEVRLTRKDPRLDVEFLGVTLQ